MSNRTAEISSSVKAAGSQVGDAMSRAEQSLESAREKYESAAMHGWAGVAGNVELAVEALEGVVVQLSTAEEACTATGGVLGEITDQMSSPEVSAHLTSAAAELETATDTTEASIALIDEAITHCQAAGLESLPARLSDLRDHTAQVLEQLGNCHREIDAEQQEADQYSIETEGGQNEGN